MQLSKTHGWVAAIVLLAAFLGSENASAQFSQQNKAGPTVTAQQIRQLQSDETKKKSFVIIDVRSVAEIDVFVIPGAITQAQFEREMQQHQQKTIIVYCTSGSRGAKYANLLKQKGWNSRNYKGSILDWCKNKLPLTTTDGKSTNRVHTYGAWNRVPREYQPVR